jgi:hypothetical protein
MGWFYAYIEGVPIMAVKYPISEELLDELLEALPLFEYDDDGESYNNDEMLTLHARLQAEMKETNPKIVILFEAYL